MSNKAGEIENRNFLEALYSAGVTNWEGYEDAIESLTDEECGDDNVVYDALEAGGVDNWEGYDIAVGIYQEEYDSDVEEEEARAQDVEEAPIEEKKQLDAADLRLKRILTDEEHERLAPAFWKQETHPEAFADAIMKSTGSGGTLLDARMYFLDYIFGDEGK